MRPRWITIVTMPTGHVSMYGTYRSEGRAFDIGEKITQRRGGEHVEQRVHPEPSWATPPTTHRSQADRLREAIEGE